MSDYNDSNRGIMPPMAGPGPYSPQVLSGTGATEESNSRAFSKDRVHMLTVGATPVRVLFSGEKGASTVVPATGGAILPAGFIFTFRAVAAATYVYMEAADGASAFTASVWQRD